MRIIVTAIFDVRIASASLFIMSLSDSLASLIGKTYGKLSIFEKTIEGSIVFFIITVLILLWFNFPSDKILYVAISCTFVELVSNRIKIDDNLLVPLTASFLLFIF